LVGIVITAVVAVGLVYRVRRRSDWVFSRLRRACSLHCGEQYRAPP
jgi:hypothetical protein